MYRSSKHGSRRIAESSWSSCFRSSRVGFWLLVCTLLPLDPRKGRWIDTSFYSKTCGCEQRGCEYKQLAKTHIENPRSPTDSRVQGQRTAVGKVSLALGTFPVISCGDASDISDEVTSGDSCVMKPGNGGSLRTAFIPFKLLPAHARRARKL